MAIKNITFQAQSDEWLDFRKKYITGTEIAALFGLNPYKSANNLALEKTCGVEFPFTGSSFVEIGKIFEDAIINQIGGKSCGNSDQVQLYYDDELRVSCTLDGILEGSPLECKCMYYNTFVNKHKKVMPPHYMMQLLLQMYMLKQNVGYFGILLYCPENFAKADTYNPSFNKYPLIIEGISLYKVEVKDLKILIKLIGEEVQRLYSEKDTYKHNAKNNKLVKKFLKENVKYEMVTDYE